MRGVKLAMIAAVSALAIVVPATPASAAGRSPRLERFVARYNPSSTTTFYIAVAGDPDGGKLTYHWSLKAECGFLTEPEATGPSQGYQHGPPARRPDGCTSEQDRKATITLRIVDPEGCAVVYTQAARDETEHIAPKTNAEPCPPRAQAAGDTPAATSFPVVPILLAGVAALMIFTVIRVRGRAKAATGTLPWDEPETASEAIPSRTLEPRAELPRDPEPSGEPEFPADEPAGGVFDEPVEAPPKESMLERMKRAVAAMTARDEFDSRSDPEPAADDPPPPAAPTPRTEPEPARGLSSEGALPTIRTYDALAGDVPAFMDDDDSAEVPDGDLEPAFTRTPPIEAGDPDEDDAALERILGAAAPGDEPCREGAIRQRDSDFVAHETLLAGTVRARALRSGNTVDIPPDDPAEILRLAAGMSDDAPLEVEVAIPVRLVTVVSSRREICRGGTWVPDVASTTHDGPERTERLRAIVTSPDELERFARDILAKRLRSLTGARRRLESALAAMRGKI